MTKFTPRLLITKLEDSVFQPYKGSVNLVFAGFPCQGFSTAGKKAVTDPRNQMFRQFVRVAKIVEPAFVIGENVTGLLSMKSGPNNEDPTMLEVIRSAFGEIGYGLTYHVLEADEFGVPQSRKRLLMIGWRLDRFPQFDPASFWASVMTWGSSRTIPKLRSFVIESLKDAIQLDPKAIPTNFVSVALPIPQSLEVSGTPHPYVTLKATKFDETYGGKTFDRLLSCGKRDSPVHSEILDLDKPCKTIICTYDHQPRLLVGLRKPDGTSYVRTLYPDELKQIQGFPEGFVLHGNQKEQVVQVGNAVPPALVEAVSTVLLSLLVPKETPKPVEAPKKKVRAVKKK
jgi:DNA (cytosine-5)-methyltransferase 1